MESRIDSDTILECGFRLTQSQKLAQGVRVSLHCPLIYSMFALSLVNV